MEVVQVACAAGAWAADEMAEVARVAVGKERGARAVVALEAQRVAVRGAGGRMAVRRVELAVAERAAAMAREVIAEAAGAAASLAKEAPRAVWEALREAVAAKTAGAEARGELASVEATAGVAAWVEGPLEDWVAAAEEGAKLPRRRRQCLDV